MSAGKYSVVEISEVERRRQQEEERKKQEEERRRLEEARKKEIERRRKEEVAAEKERIALAKRFQEMATINQFEKNQSSKNRQSESKKSDLSKEMSEQVNLMKKQLSAFPELLSDYFADRLQGIKDIMQKAEKGGFNSYHYNQLKEASRKLAILSGTVEKELEDMFQRINEKRKECEQIIIDMDMVAGNAPLDEHRRRARTIITALNSLLRESRLEYMDTSLKNLRFESLNLWEEYVRSRESDQMRRYLMQNIKDVFAEIGYQVMQIDIASPNFDAKDQASENPLYFRTPGKGLVKMSLGSDQAFAANYMLPIRSATIGSDISQAEAVADCRNWCLDYDYLRGELLNRNILLQEKSRIEAGEASIKEVIVPEAFFETDESLVYRSEEEKRRRL